MDYQGRPINFKSYYKGKWISGEGTFIKWGSDVNTNTGAPFQVTFAVIEAKDGKVYRVDEDDLTFTDI